jgi:hypothetical protein
MPDWFYRTVSRPVLFRLPVSRSRNLALGFMGRFARLPLGLAMIDFLGHMRADDRLRQSFLGIDFPTAVGLGPWLDTEAAALPALSRFGFGFLEVGPVTIAGSRAERPLERLDDQQAFWFSTRADTLALTQASPRLKELSGLDLPVVARLGFPHDASVQLVNDECQRLIHELSPCVHLFSISTLELALAEGWPLERWTDHVKAILDSTRISSMPRPVLLCVTADMDQKVIASLIEAALAAGIQGLVVDGRVPAKSDGQLVGLPAREQARHQVQRLRELWGEDLLIIASGGVHEPADALELRSAGANLVQVDSGLVFTGPGLPKRINDAFL